MLKFIAKYKVDNVKRGTLEECLSYLKTLKVISVDIETGRKFKRGLYPEDVYRPGLDPFVTRVIMFQVGDDKKQFVFDMRDCSKEYMQPLFDFLHYNPAIIIVGANLKFEARHLALNYGLEFHTIYDVMLGELCLYNGLTVDISLAGLAERYLGVPKKKEITLFESPYLKKTITLDPDLLEEYEEYITPFEVADDFQLDKSTRLQFINIGDKPFTYDQVTYGADDIIFPILIRQRQLVGRVLSDGTVHRPLNWMKVENHYCLVLAEMENNGMPVVREMWEALHDKNEIIMQKRQAAITNYVLQTYPEYSAGTFDLFTGEKQCHIKWTSPKQVVEFYKKLDKCPRAYSKQTQQVEYTVEAKELLRTLPNALKIKYQKDKDVEIVDHDTFTLMFLLFKKSEQAIKTYGRKWLKNIHPITGRVHSNYRQILNTTRISSTNPNLNNVSGGDWRACFRVEEDYEVVNADAQAQELRAAAQLTQDPYMMDFFINGDEYFGEDMHSWSATKLYRVLEENEELIVPPKETLNDKGEMVKHPDFTEADNEKRGNSKATTFSIFYGASAYSLSQDLGVTVEEGEKIYKGYLETFPGVKDYFTFCEKWANEHDYILIDEFTEAKYFYPLYQEIKDLYKKAWDEFPEGYSNLKKYEKEAAKKQLYEEKPWVKELFRKAGRLKGSFFRKNLNYRIQGACAQQLKIAMNIFRKHRIEGGHDYKLIANIYDEVLVQVKKEQGEECGKLVSYCMEKAGKILFKDIPQKAAFVLAQDWKH